MYRYLFRKNPYILLYFILAPFRALSSVAVAGALSVAIDFANSGDLADIWKYVLVFSIYILLDLLIDAADQAVRLRITKNVMVALKSDVYHKLSRMCYVRFFQRNSADYLSNMTTDAETLRASYFYIVLNMYANFLRCAVALGFERKSCRILDGKNIPYGRSSRTELHRILEKGGGVQEEDEVYKGMEQFIVLCI